MKLSKKIMEKKGTKRICYLIIMNIENFNVIDNIICEEKCKVKL